MRSAPTLAFVSTMAMVLCACEAPPTTFTPPQTGMFQKDKLKGTLTVKGDDRVEGTLVNNVKLVGAFEGGGRADSKPGELVFGLTGGEASVNGVIAPASNIATTLPKSGEAKMDMITLDPRSDQRVTYDTLWTYNTTSPEFVQELKKHCGQSVDVKIDGSWNFSSLDTEGWKYNGPEEVPFTLNGPIEIACP